MTVNDMIYRFLKELESVHPMLVNGQDRPDTETILAHLNKTQNSIISQKYAAAGGIKMKSDAFNAFYDEFKELVTGQLVTDLSSLPDAAHYGKLGALPTGYMHYLRSNSSVTRTDPSDSVSYQIEIITLTGTSGTATIALDDRFKKTIRFTTSLAITAANFYIANVAEYLAQNIVLTNVGNTIVMTSLNNGGTFTAPTITNESGTLTGTVAHTYSTASWYPNQLGTFKDITNIMTTASNKPMFTDPIILLHKTSFWVVVDSYTTVNAVYFIYITQPTKLEVGGTSQISEFLHEDIVSMAVKDYLMSRNLPNEKTVNINK